MKLLIIFDKNIKISPEKICIHVGNSTREITAKLIINPMNHRFYGMWQRKKFKTILLNGKITNSLKDKLNNYLKYEIYDTGLDGTFVPNTLLGYAILVEDNCEDFNKIQTLKFKD